ncbi:MerR family transcriptional regulator [Clostridium paraputrificum]|uniref:MerR family transcriptional regulator n=1 Tax=Clostridium paraputrificum TaxID=29363 RepID=UPI003D340954
MNTNSYMQIKEFSRLTGIKRENLRYYDQIGLLSPEYRGENGYRYYTQRQLTSAYLILSLRELGIGIEEIKKYVDRRSPEEMFSLFSSQKKNILKEMKRLRRTLEIMDLYVGMAEDALKYDENIIRIEYKEKEPIFIGPLIPSDDIYDSVISFYDFAAENGFDLGYPLGAIISEENLKSGDELLAARYYFKVENDNNSYKPEGKYAILYGRCAYGESDDLYKNLITFIQENKLRLCGDAYEEYPLNELSTIDDKQYCVKIEILVEDL